MCVITVSNNISSDFDITNPNCVLVETENNYAKSLRELEILKDPKTYWNLWIQSKNSIEIG